MPSLATTLPLVLAAAFVPAPSGPAAVAAPTIVPIPCEEAYLGVYLAPGDLEGAQVTRVLAGSPAEAAGLRGGDRIVALGGQAVAGADGLAAIVAEHRPGQELELVYFRGADKRIAAVRLADKADSEEARSPEPIELLLPRFPSPEPEVSAPRLPHMLLPEPGRIEIPSIEILPPLRVTQPEWQDDDLQERLQEMRERMDHRWVEMADRLEALRQEMGANERLRDLQRELQASREDQLERYRELREALERMPEPQPEEHLIPTMLLPEDLMRAQELPQIEIEWIPVAPQAQPAQAQPSPAPIPTPALDAQDAPATADEVRQLRDEVRALRAELGELRNLLGAGR